MGNAAVDGGFKAFSTDKPFTPEAKGIAGISYSWGGDEHGKLDLAKASREHTEITLGLSTRGALALLRAARIAAGLRGAQFVTPDDVKTAVPLVMPHRLTLASEALLEGTTELSVTQRLLEQVPVPR